MFNTLGETQLNRKEEERFIKGDNLNYIIRHMVVNNYNYKITYNIKIELSRYIHLILT